MDKKMDKELIKTYRSFLKDSVHKAIENRESRRSYSRQPLSIEELSLLLWATQGIRQKLDSGHALRTVPSAGCRHAFETYLCILNVQDLGQGIYRYLPLEHQLLFEFAEENLDKKIIHAALGQSYPGIALTASSHSSCRAGRRYVPGSPASRRAA